MTIHEPATLVTDMLLAALAGGCMWRLHHGRRPVDRATWWWSGALALTALSALVGGLYHGLAPNFPAIEAAWWKLTLLCVGLVSAAMAVSLIHVLLPPARQRGWQVLIAAKFTSFLVLLLTAPRFVIAVVDYGLVMLAWAAAAAWCRRAWSGWMLTAIACSAIAAAVQQLRWGLSPRFNHNDVYHVIQGAAIYAFYRAGRRFGPAGGAPR